jgi:hypothetical protein
MNILQKKSLIDQLLSNTISVPSFERLRSEINESDLSLIIQKIYDLNDEQVRKIAALAPVMAKVDSLKNAQRNGRFTSRVKNGFRNSSDNKVILVEGDSWFNYPVLLSDVIDWISMNKNLAVYSLASGGDWLLNMLSARRYIEQLSTIHPDVFIISGGGNDLVGGNRIAAMVTPAGKSSAFFDCDWAMKLMQKTSAPIDPERFSAGMKYISNDFFALLMFFHLQYYHIFNGILTGGSGNPKKTKFPGIKIITQGYDYVIPSRDKGFGLNPLKWYKPFARMFLGHGSWLKTPMDIRGISCQEHQRDAVYAMIYLFNEMMIETGEVFEKMAGYKCVFHIDSRGAVGENGWTDELHPLPGQFKKIAAAFVRCINDKSPSQLVYPV